MKEKKYKIYNKNKKQKQKNYEEPTKQKILIYIQP